MLENVKVGDKLLVSSNGGSKIATVKRITPKGFIVVTYGNGEVTFRSDGHERTSDAWHWRTARPITDDDIAEMRIAALRTNTQRAVNAHIGTLTEEQCQAIVRIIKDGE